MPVRFTVSLRGTSISLIDFGRFPQQQRWFIADYRIGLSVDEWYYHRVGTRSDDRPENSRRAHTT